MNPFETETMANLCLRQGHKQEALAIYGRLLERTFDESARERLRRRIGAVERETGSPQASSPAEPPAPPAAARERPDEPQRPSPRQPPLPMSAVRARWSGDVLTVEWRLPPGTAQPGLEVLLVKQGPAGVVAETRAIAVEGDAGQITLTVSGLHLARAAAGYRTDGHFVPVARG